VGEKLWGLTAKWDSLGYRVAASDIYLAVAVEKRDVAGRWTEFDFRVEEVLRGKKLKTISLKGGDLAKIKDPKMIILHDLMGLHTSPEFWASKEHNGPYACDGVGNYRIGVRYLLFVADMKLKGSFEPVVSEDDLWLRTIRLLVERENELEEVQEGAVAEGESPQLKSV